MNAEPAAKPYERYLERRIWKRQLLWTDNNEAHLAEFKKNFGPGASTRWQRNTRKDILRWFGKPPEDLNLDEYRDFSKPSFQARDFLRELWPRLTSAEQEIVKNLTEWAWIFPASFETEREFLLACASRLENWFGRPFPLRNDAPR
jgi:hypothetical protein